MRKGTRLIIKRGGVLFIIMALSTGLLLTGCHAPFLAPNAVFFNDPPIPVTTEQIFAHYSLDPQQADLKYLGKGVMFNDVTVQELDMAYFAPTTSGGRTYYVMHFFSGNVKYRLKDEDFDLMQSVQQGYILNIVGICQGIQDGCVVVDECWIQSVFGELSSNLSPYVGY